MSGKSDFRRLAAGRRARAFAVNPLAGLTLAAQLPRDAFPPAGTAVSGYWPFRSEIDPRPLMARLARAGARLALPITPAKGADIPLSFRLWTPEAPLAPSRFGIHEPDPAGEAVAPDVLLVPLLAFDRTGARLGYGAGHYDRTLATLRAERPIRAIGLAFAAQEVERIPIGPHDQPLDAVLTEKAFIDLSSNSLPSRP